MISGRGRLLLLFLMSLAHAGWSLEFYVATEGQDGNPGTESQPFRSIERARDAIRALKKEGRTSSPVTVYVRGGVYSLPRTISLGAEDSGTEDAAIVYRAYRDERPILMGGRPLTGFVPYEGRILKTDIRAQGIAGSHFRVLVFDGKRQELARYPNRNTRDVNGGDWAYVEGQRYDMYSDSPDEDGYLEKNKHLDFWQRNIPRLTRTLRLKPEDVHSWGQIDQAEVSIFPRFNWWHYLLPVRAFDPETHTLTLGEGCFYEIRPGDRYFIRNLIEELDSPGEWYLDSEGGMLYFWPPVPLDGRPVYAAALETIVEMKACSYVSFQGFTMECCEGTAVLLKDCQNCRVAGNTISNAGGYDGYGVHIDKGKRNGIIGNDIYDIGSYGVLGSGGDAISLEPGGNSVDNNTIHHVGLVGRQAKGVEFTGSGNRITHNLIHDVPQSGVWLWGNKHVVEFNHIRHTCLEGEDTGAIGGGAIDWVSWLGVVIRNNYIHDTMGYGFNTRKGRWQSPYFTYAIYPDWAASGVVISGNICARAGCGLINLHSGRDNLIENNILLDGRESQVDCNGWTTATGFWSTKVKEWTETYEKAAAIPAWRDVPAFKDPRSVPLPNGQVMLGNVIRRNIFVYSGKESSIFRFRNVPLDRNSSDSNLIYHFGEPLLTGEKGLARETGENRMANPGLEEGPSGERPKGWGIWVSDAKTEVRVDEAQFHEGQFSLRVDPPAMAPEDQAPKTVYLGLGAMPFEPGKVHRLSAWMRGDEALTPVTLSVFSWKKDVHNWSEEKSASVTTEWRQFELLVRLPNEGEDAYKKTMESLGWRVSFPTGAGRFWIDDLSLREAELSDEWEGWRALGQDLHSVVADPLFVDLELGDYRLRPESPAFALGFQTIPVEEIGPYQDALRASWPVREAEGAREACGQVPSAYP